MNSNQSANVRSEDGGNDKPHFDVAFLIMKNFNKINDEDVAQLSQQDTIQTRQTQAKNARLQSVLQEKCVNQEKRKADEGTNRSKTKTGNVEISLGH